MLIVRKLHGYTGGVTFDKGMHMSLYLLLID